MYHDFVNSGIYTYIVYAMGIHPVFKVVDIVSESDPLLHLSANITDPSIKDLAFFIDCNLDDHGVITYHESVVVNKDVSKWAFVIKTDKGGVPSYQAFPNNREDVDYELDRSDQKSIIRAVQEFCGGYV
jgi:hypothetical protein